jgi:hypothetical protein
MTAVDYDYSDNIPDGNPGGIIILIIVTFLTLIWALIKIFV